MPAIGVAAEAAFQMVSGGEDEIRSIKVEVLRGEFTRVRACVGDRVFVSHGL
jgi:hypothetical protein